LLARIKNLISPASILWWVWLSLGSEILLVATGGLVRLTGSGLGCPTWPKCTEDSLVSVPEQGIYGFIEFANRTLTILLAVIALGTFLAVRRLPAAERKGLLWPGIALGLGIVVQALVGGITVLTNLTWWIVGIHFVLSALMIGIAAILVWNFYRPDLTAVPRLVRDLSWLVLLVGAVTVVIGVLVTGAGPHAGDADTARSGFDLEVLQHWHSYPAYILMILVTIQLSRLLPADRQKSLSQWRRATQVTFLLLLTLALQATVGIAQARLGVPAALVEVHMILAAVIVTLLTWQRLALRLQAPK
jgi:cytochrome c oxidase assembly protein subunit 15